MNYCTKCMHYDVCEYEFRKHPELCEDNYVEKKTPHERPLDSNPCIEFGCDNCKKGTPYESCCPLRCGKYKFCRNCIVKGCISIPHICDSCFHLNVCRVKYEIDDVDCYNYLNYRYQ